MNDQRFRNNRNVTSEWDPPVVLLGFLESKIGLSTPVS